MIEFRDLVGEIEAGLKHEKSRLEEAWHNRQFAEERFDAYPTRVENARGERLDYRRTSGLLARVAEVLTQHLYKRPPRRSIEGHPEATKWLQETYKRRAFDAKLRQADWFTVVSDVAAIQFAGDDDPDDPIRINLWPADQLIVWEDPDDATKPEAVAVIDRYDGARRLRLFSRERTATFLTARTSPGQTAGGTAYRLAEEDDNPYRTADGEGVLPFAFVHYHFPTVDFWSGGPGTELRRANDHLNYRWDTLGDALRYLRFPIGLISGADPGWSPPAMYRPGEYLCLPGHPGDANGAGSTTPTLTWSQPPLGFVQEDLNDLNAYLDHVLEMHGVPPSTIRMIESARSGLAIVAEQAPLLARAEDRRVPFGRYEECSARTAVRVAAAHLRNNGRPDRSLEAAAADPDFALGLRWPAMYVLPPGPERDRSDDWRVERGLASWVQVMQEREDLTEDQAVEALLEVERLNGRLREAGLDPDALGPKPPPPPPPPPGANGPPTPNADDGADAPPVARSATG